MRSRPAGFGVVLAFLLAAGASIPGRAAPSPGTSDGAPREGLLTRQQAIDLVLEQVILPDPEADQLAAFLYNRVAPDSLVPAGTEIASWDSGLVVPVPEDSYLFWLDREPDALWLHPTRFVLVTAASGLVLSFDAESWPVVGGEEVRRFPVEGNASPELFYGGYAEGPGGYLFTPVDRPPNGSWGVILAGYNFEGAGDAQGIRSDVNRLKKILSGTAHGPEVGAGSITVVGEGTPDATGVTLEAFCDSLAAIPPGCNKLYFAYIGHGYDGGIYFRSAHGNDDRVSYKTLAEKLIGTGAKEICLLITACHSGSATGPLGRARAEGPDGKDTKLKGVVVTSSKTTDTTPIDPDGTPFLKGVVTCMEDSLADLNRDGKVDLAEATAWAKDQDPKVAEPDPQGEVLGDGREIRFPPPETDSKTSRTDRGGKLTFELTTVCYEIVEGSAGGKDSLVCRSRVYVVNEESRAHVGKRSVDIVCLDGKNHEIGRSSHTFNLDPGQRLCLLDLPGPCDHLKIEPTPEAPGGVRGVAAFLSGAAAGSRTGVYRRGEFIYQETVVGGLPGETFGAAVDPVAGWGLGVGPDPFTLSAVIDTQVVTVTGAMPDTATAGALLSARIIGGAGPDTVDFHVQALVLDSLGVALAGGQTYLRRNVLADAGLQVSAGVLGLAHSVVVPRAAGPGLVGPVGTLDCAFTALRPDSGVAWSLAVQGSLAWDTSTLVDPAGGLTLDAPAAAWIRGGGVLGSAGAGLTLAGDAGGVDLDGFHIEGSGGDGLVLDAASNCLLRAVDVSASGGDDVALVNGAAAELRDCAFDTAKVAVDPGSELLRTFTTSFLVRTDAGEAVPGATVTVTDLQGTPVASGNTDTLGYRDPVVLAARRWDGPATTAFTPHAVRIQVGEVDSTFSYTADARRMVEIVLPAGSVTGTGGGPVPGPLFLAQNAPNPVRGSTRIRFRLPEAGPVRLAIYDAAGREVAVPLSGQLEAGEHEAPWRPDPAVASGIYFYRLETPRGTRSRKLLLVR